MQTISRSAAQPKTSPSQVHVIDSFTFIKDGELLFYVVFSPGK